MKTRILTACVGVPLLIAVLILGGRIAEAMAEAVTLIAMWECYHALKAGGYKPCVWGGYAAAALMCPLAWGFGIRDPLIYVTAAMGVSLTGVILSDEPTFPNAAVSIYPIFTVLLPFVMFMMMMNTKFGTVPGRALVVMSFAVSFIGDAAAYFGGRTLGRISSARPSARKRRLKAPYSISSAVWPLPLSAGRCLSVPSVRRCRAFRRRSFSESSVPQPVRSVT